MMEPCKYCYKLEDKQYNPGLSCDSCKNFVHLVCLRRPGTPGDLSGDVYFDYVCADCSTESKEVFTRNKVPWLKVIILTLHHLHSQAYGISNNGYFHYKTHLCSFIDRNWSILFGSQFKQKKNWMGTIAGALSSYSNIFFQSGSAVLGETGWWRLLHKFSPAVLAHILQELSRDKSRGRSKSPLAVDSGIFLQVVTNLGYKDLMDSGEFATTTKESDPVPCKKRRVDSDDLSQISNTTYFEYFDSDSRIDSREDSEYPDLNIKDDSFSEAESLFTGFDDIDCNPIQPSDSSSVQSLQPSVANYDSDSESGSAFYNIPTDAQSDESEDQKPVLLETNFADIAKMSKPQYNKERPPIALSKDSLFSKQPNSLGVMPWLDSTETVKSEEKSDLVRLTVYEEIQLLKRVEAIIPSVKDPEHKAHLRRFRAKLALRRLKRHRHMPLFDIDKMIKCMAGYETEERNAVEVNEHVLDRFRASSLIDSLSGTIASSVFATMLIGHMEAIPFVSPYSGTVLKPYIRREAESKPLWLRVMDEMLQKANKNQPDYVPPAPATIDFSYVRPQHIAAINNLCTQFFWPGVDLTETLEYPEFSCVVTYKKLVIGFAFLVPDVGPNKAYISFICTRPEWRKAKIATFMLYHLLQTCTDKDVTLHVSPTNPAVFLYQKFGFKVEELIQDFYEKYYEPSSKDCKHALFLRLSR